MTDKIEIVIAKPYAATLVSARVPDEHPDTFYDKYETTAIGDDIINVSKKVSVTAAMMEKIADALADYHASPNRNRMTDLEFAVVKILK